MSNIPKLRFPEFTDAWEKWELGDLVNINSGKDYKHLSKGNIPVYGTGGYMLSVNEALSYGEDAIGIGRKGTIDKPYILKAPFWTVDTLFYAIPYVNYDLNFIFCIFQITNWKEKDESTGVPSLSKTTISKLPVRAPTLLEQQKIGNLFKQLDRLITLHKRKWDDVILLKKALLQKMFPKNGSDFPALRFPEFTDAWEKCKLGEAANIIMGQSPSSKFYTDNTKDYILVQGNADLKNGWVMPRVWTTQRTKVGKKGDLIFSVRAPVGEIGKTNYDVVLGRGVAAIQGNEFIFQTLSKMNIFGFWKTLSTGSTFDAINSNELRKVEINIPTLPEQQKIGNLFKQLDRLITLHKRQHEHYQLLKKALLQQMFV